MDYARFVRLRSPTWDRFEAAQKDLDRLNGRGARISYEELERASVLYRQVLHDHSLAASRFPEMSAARRLERLAVSGARRLTRDRAARLGGFWSFFFRTFPRVFQKQRGTIGLVVVLFLAVTALGLGLTIRQPAFGTFFVGPEAVADLARGQLWTEALTTTSVKPAASSFIATNNLSVAITAWAGGAIAGLGSLYVVILNGFMLGSVIGLTLHYSMADAILEFIAAHGPLELTVIMVSAAAGLVMARGLLAAEDRPRSETLREAVGDGLVLLVGCLPWLVVLAVVEVLVSPEPTIALWVKVVLGLTLESLFLTLALSPAGRQSSLDRLDVLEVEAANGSPA